jgi:integration host factor subunit beta
MTKSELAAQLADRFPEILLKDAGLTVQAVLDAMSGALAMGQRVEIRGFGSFSIRHRLPRTGRNPKSGAQVAVPEKRLPHFKPGWILRERVSRHQT